MPLIPPGGFAGFAQQTDATRLLFSRGVRKGGTRMAGVRRKRRKKTAAKSTRRRTRTRARKSSKRPARLVKGSAAAKRYMASIRRKRR